jgi:hypothetical protein
MKRYPFHIAERIFWVGALLLFFIALFVGRLCGYLVQLPILAAMVAWGIFVRRFMTLS